MKMISPFCNISKGSFLKDKIVSKEDIMDVLILHLDRSVCLAPGVPAIQRWEHLADQFKVPDDVKSQCANFSGKLSSSESLFEHLRVTKDSLTVKKVKSYLKKLERNDVVAELEKNSHLKGNPLAPFEAHVCFYQQCETFYIELVYLLPNFGFLTLDYRAPNQLIFPLYFCDPVFFLIGQRFTFYMVNSSFYRVKLTFHMVNFVLFLWSSPVYMWSSRLFIRSTLYFYTVNLSFYMVKSTFHMVNFVLFIWSTFYFLYVQVDFLYGQVDFSHRQLFTFYIGQCKMQTADFRLEVKCRLKTADQG